MKGKAYKIAVIPGDGTGPEVVGEGLKVLKAVSKKFNFSYTDAGQFDSGTSSLMSFQLKDIKLSLNGDASHGGHTGRAVGRRHAIRRHAVGWRHAAACHHNGQLVYRPDDFRRSELGFGRRGGWGCVLGL